MVSSASGAAARMVARSSSSSARRSGGAAAIYASIEAHLVILFIACLRRVSPSSCRIAGTLHPAPATPTIGGDDVFDHGREGGRLDRVALPNGDGARGRVAVAAGDDPLGIRSEAAIVEEDVDVVLRRLQ